MGTIVSQFSNSSDWIISSTLQQVNHFFEHIMIRNEHDTSTWNFFLDPGVPCGWGKII